MIFVLQLTKHTPDTVVWGLGDREGEIVDHRYGDAEARGSSLAYCWWQQDFDGRV